MKETILHEQYIVIDPGGDPVFKTITEMKEFAVSVHYADCMPASTIAAAKKAGYKLIKCDIVFVNIKEII